MTQRNFRVRNGLTIDGTTSGSSSFASTATGTDLSYVLPGAQGAASTVLTNDGSGNLTWALPGGGGSTFGNITVAVVDDNTISTTTGDLVLDSATNQVNITAGLSVDSGVLYVDPTNNRVGINNTSPQYELHIDQGLDAFTQFGMTTAERTALWTMNDSDDLLSLSYGTTPGATNRLLFSPTDQWFGVGKLGIGTATPAYTLDVAGNSYFSLGVELDEALQINGSTSGYSLFKAPTTGSNLNYQLPGTAGAANTVLTNDGTGVLSWALPGGGGSTFGNVTVGVDTDQTISTTSGNLILQTAAGVNAGTVTLTAGANGNITLDPNGTGNVVVTLADNGNLTNDRNYVFGAIRNSLAQAAGNIFSFSTTAAGGPTQGISLDNSINTTKRPGVVLRSYGGGLASGNPVTTVITETARGSAASPAGLASGNGMGSYVAGGYADTSAGGTGAGWVSDLTGNTAASIAFQTTEAWTGGTGTGSPLGTRVRISTNPTGSANALQTSLEINPQATLARSDAFTWSQGKTGTTQTMALDVSGNLTLTGDLRINGNDIKGSGGNTAITLTSANTSTTIFSDGTFFRDAATFPFANLLANDGSNKPSLSVTKINAASGSEFPYVNFDTYRGTGGTSYTPTQAGDRLGEFKYNGNALTGSSPGGTSGPAVSISADATENWSVSAQGSKVNFSANKIGTTTSYNVIAASPDSLSLSSNSIAFKTYDSVTNLLTIDNLGNVAITGDLQINGNDIKASDGATAMTMVPITSFNPNTDFTGNIVKGQIRTGGGASTGDIFQISGASASVGISADNTDKPTDRTSLVLRNYGGSLAGGAPRANIIFESARGSAASPTNITNGSVLGDILATGYTSTGWASDVSTTVPGLARFYATENWNNGASNVGTGFRVILNPAATTLSSANLITALQITPEVSVIRSDDTTILSKSGQSLANVGQDGNGHNTLTVAQYRATTPDEFALTNFETFRSTDGINFTPTQNTDILGSFKYNGNAYTSTSPGVPGGPGAEILARATEDWTSTANGTKISVYAMKTGTVDSYAIIEGNPNQLNFSSNQINLNEFDNSATFATVSATSATFNVPVGFPVDTASNWNTVTGSVGQQVCVSDSAGGGNPDGMMAFWDTTNSRWSYIHDNSAV